jgi:hypothetical protein
MAWEKIKGFPGYEIDRQSKRVRSWIISARWPTWPRILTPMPSKRGDYYNLQSGEAGKRIYYHFVIDEYLKENDC